MLLELRHRNAIGILLVVVTVVFFAAWAWYFIHLVRPIDSWDLSPLPLILGPLLIGTWLGGIRVGAAIIRPQLKHDALAALAAGAFIAFGLNILFNAVATPTTIDSYQWLSELQEAGGYIGERVRLHLYPLVGHVWSLRVAVLCGYAALVAQWTAAVLAVLVLSRATVRACKALSRP